MHMADALISPAVGGTMYAATAGLIAYSSKKLNDEMDSAKIPLMGIMGAFIFAAQMLNFTIPATGSSGHIGGGLLLSIVLGPYAAFVTMASVLIIQALFFGDGGLLALGCNIFNLGFFTCFIAYPLVYRPVAGKGASRLRVVAGSLVAAVVGLQLGSLAVVIQTVLSGISALPFKTFVLLMQPIHLAIGVVEGIATAAVALFVMRVSPELLDGKAAAPSSRKSLLAGLGAAAILFGVLFSWFASTHPDGLEWSIGKTTGAGEMEETRTGIYGLVRSLQEKTAVMPDYGFSESDETAPPEDEEKWPAVSGGTSLAGILGGVLVLALAAAAGAVIYIARKRKKIAKE